MNAERAIQTVEPGGAPVIVADASSILAVIARAASDPNTDVEKLERLANLYERITAQGAKAAYFAALAEMQPKLPVVDRKGTISVPAKDGKTGHETPYARWEDINDAIRPALAEHGFALSFRIGKEADRVVVSGILSHRDGHSEETTLSLPMDTTGSKNNVQAIGSSVSYGKRYTAGALLNFTTRGEDDDGKNDGARGMGEVAQRAIGEINLAASLDALRAWKSKNYDGVSKMVTPDELKEIVVLYNRRSKTFRAATAASAEEPASDFPGDR